MTLASLTTTGKHRGWSWRVRPLGRDVDGVLLWSLHDSGGVMRTYFKARLDRVYATARYEQDRIIRPLRVP